MIMLQHINFNYSLLLFSHFFRFIYCCHLLLIFVSNLYTVLYMHLYSSTFLYIIIDQDQARRTDAQRGGDAGIDSDDREDDENEFDFVEDYNEFADNYSESEEEEEPEKNKRNNKKNKRRDIDDQSTDDDDDSGDSRHVSQNFRTQRPNQSSVNRYHSNRRSQNEEHPQRRKQEQATSSSSTRGKTRPMELNRGRDNVADEEEEYETEYESQNE